jgi:L-asparaginase / beta-aspartyl-peptidase
MRIARTLRPITPGLVAAILAACGAPMPPAAGGPAAEPPSWGIVIHGGAGTLRRESMTPEREAEYRAKLEEALRAGHRVLADGGSSLEAVQAAVMIMEDSPLFNAGRGAVLTSEGAVEMDASIMDGRTLEAGAVAGVKHVRNPIALARLVMEHTPHVMLMGEGAAAFAREQGVEMASEGYFITDFRLRQLQEVRDNEAREPRHERPEASTGLTPEARTSGTVGAVALDRSGNLAAATSTGGMTNKRWGRIGDAPIIGAGTYADNESCAVSATGHGEYFIRAVVAHDICARMRYGGQSLAAAAEAVVMDRLVRMGGTGGVIAIDRRGNIALPFNTTGMYRGSMGADGRVHVSIFQN